MASLLTQKSSYKNPPWMKNKPFPKGKGGGFGAQLFAVLIVSIIGLMLYY